MLLATQYSSFPCPFSTTTKSDGAFGCESSGWPSSSSSTSSASCRCRLWCISRLFLRCRCVRCLWWWLLLLLNAGLSCITTGSSAASSSPFISAGSGASSALSASSCGRTLPRESLELQRELQQLPLEELLEGEEEEEERLIVLILLNELSLSLSTLPSSCTVVVVVVSDGCDCAWSTLSCAFNAGMINKSGGSRRQWTESVNSH